MQVFVDFLLLFYFIRLCTMHCISGYVSEGHQITSLNINKLMVMVRITQQSGGSRISEIGAPTTGGATANLLFDKILIFTENCTKKERNLTDRSLSLAPSVDPPLNAIIPDEMTYLLCLWSAQCCPLYRGQAGHCIRRHLRHRHEWFLLAVGCSIPNLLARQLGSRRIHLLETWLSLLWTL